MTDSGAVDLANGIGKCIVIKLFIAVTPKIKGVAGWRVLGGAFFCS